MWNIKKQVIEAWDVVLEQYGIEKTSIERDYYSKWAWSISEAIGSVLSSENKESDLKKYKRLKDIFRSDICVTAFKKGSFAFTTDLYAKVLKTRSAWIIMLCNYLSVLRRR